jgi:ribosomal protein L34
MKGGIRKSVLKRKRTFGFMARKQAGTGIMQRRRRKGRHILCVANR